MTRLGFPMNANDFTSNEDEPSVKSGGLPIRPAEEQGDEGTAKQRRVHRRLSRSSRLARAVTFGLSICMAEAVWGEWSEGSVLGFGHFQIIHISTGTAARAAHRK
jgi:hypothetical protein